MKVGRCRVKIYRVRRVSRVCKSKYSQIGEDTAKLCMRRLKRDVNALSILPAHFRRVVLKDDELARKVRRVVKV